MRHYRRTRFGGSSSCVVNIIHIYCKSRNLPNTVEGNYSIDLRQFLRHPVYLLCDTDGPGERQDTKTSSRPRRSVSGSAGETPPTTCTGTLRVLRPYIASVAGGKEEKSASPWSAEISICLTVGLWFIFMKDILNSWPNFEKKGLSNQLEKVMPYLPI